MKKIFLAIVLLVFLTPISVQAKENIKYSSTDLNVRTEPNIKSKVVTVLNTNDKLKIIGQTKRWYIIKYNHKERYVFKKYVSNKKVRYITKSCPSNSFKSYEPYTLLKHYAQGDLQKKAYTDSNGLRKVGNRYCIALGSYYVTKVGTKVDLVMKNGSVVKCIIGDLKADKDTNGSNQTRVCDGSLCEFIVDTSRLPRIVKQMGDVSYAMNELKGSVKSIRIWRS